MTNITGGIRTLVIDIPVALYGQLKAHAAATSEPMAAIVRRLIEEYFAEDMKPPP